MGKFNNNILLPHNNEAYLKVIEHFKYNNRAAVVHATGTGKSYIIAAVADKFPGKVIVLAPNYFVLDESRKLCSERIEFRTFASLMYDESPADDYQLICIDEFHRAGAEEWGKGVARLLEANPNAKVLGTTATTIRYLDGQRNMADELFDGNVVSSLSLREAIDLGIIQEPTYVASLYAFKETYSAIKEQIMASNKKSEEDKMKAMRTLNGIAHNWENAHGVSLVMRKYLHKDIKRVVVFCSKVAKAAKARDILGPWFAGAGFKHIRFYNIDYKEKNVKKEMEDFQMDNFDGIKVAISVNMLNEGVHVDGVDAVVMMRNTVSPNIILQQIGRCLTAKKTEHKPVILDLVNNMDTLGEVNLWAFAGAKSSAGVRDDDNSMGKGFPFSIIDECRDIRTFLTQVQNEFDVVTDFYKAYGVGMFGLNKAFRIDECNAPQGGILFRPINNMDMVMLDDLVGYEIQKKKLVDNTEAFVRGKKANNVLLFGDSGTGKSTSIKAIVNQYYNDGLRMIEIYKHQFKYLSTVIAEIKNRNYKFIIYMDDLSFEEFEIEYKFLKAVIEGGVETKPDNILIYATSNRRHLIKENWNDRNDQDNTNDRHHSDTVEEKLSLVNRFGVTINYSKPTQKEYFDIVIHLARRAGVTLSDDELKQEANKWELSHGGISGRTAEQFVSYLASQEHAFQ